MRLKPNGKPMTVEDILRYAGEHLKRGDNSTFWHCWRMRKIWTMNWKSLETLGVF